MTSIYVQWDAVTSTDGIQITGYKLYKDDGLNGAYTLLYDGSNYPYILTYSAVSLTTGLPYRLKVTSLNINGASPESNYATIYACLIPSKVVSPYKVATS